MENLCLSQYKATAYGGTSLESKVSEFQVTYEYITSDVVSDI